MYQKQRVSAGRVDEKRYVLDKIVKRKQIGSAPDWAKSVFCTFSM